MIRVALVPLVVFAGASIEAAVATAQAPTAVQLPTYHSFSMSTTVVVPDRGAMLLGGVDRAASGEISGGVPGFSHVPGANRLFKNRALGRETSRSTASVSVWIHDLQAMDEALLAEAAARRDAGKTAIANRANETAGRLTSHLPAEAAASHFDSRRPTPATEDRPESLVAIRAQQAEQAEQAAAEARDLVAQGDQARANGKPAVAKIFYQMAARRSPATMASVIPSRLQLLAARK